MSKVTILASNPVFIDFEGYTGMTALLQSAPFGPPYPGSGYTGPYTYPAPDGGVDGVLSMVTGRTGGTIDGGMDWAVDLKVASETQWGTALAFWMSCADASAFKGISFWVRGQAPGFALSLSLSTNDTTPVASSGTCTGTCASPAASTTGGDAGLPIAPNWTQISLPWASFTGGLVNGAARVPNGDNLTGMQFVVSNTMYVAVDAGPDGAAIYGPMPGPIDLQIDDIQFMP